MGLNYSPKIITSGLVLYLDAANPKSYPGTGTSWFDLSTSNYVATIGGSPVLTGNYFQFNAAGTKYAVITKVVGSPLWSFTNNCSIVLGFRDNSASGNWESIAGFADADSNINIFHASGSRYFQNNSPMLTNAVAMNTLGWNIWSITVSSGSSKLFMNSTLIAGPTAGTWTAPSGGFGIARCPEGTYGHSNLDFSFVQVYNRGLSDAEVLQNFNSLKGRFNL
jgi:hypothetical protein